MDKDSVVDKDIIVVKKEYPINSKSIGLLVACLFLGVISNILLFDKMLGISYPIFVLCFYAVFLWYNRSSIAFKWSFGWMLSIPIVLLSFTYFIYSNEIFMVLNFLAVPVLIIAQTILLTKANGYNWYQFRFIQDILCGIFSRTLLYLAVPFKITKGLINKQSKNFKVNTFSRILIGLLISFPILMVVIMLLSSADQVFGNILGSIPAFFEKINLSEFIVRFLWVTIVGCIAFSYLWSLTSETAKVKAVTDKPAAVGVWDSVIVITVLVSINLIYVLFTSVQFAYLFGGIVPDGFTYSEYARRGFFELILVTLINLAILLSNLYFKKDGGKAQNLTARILNSLLVVCTAIMLISAHYRMSMYEEAYGYTYLRIMTHSFMVFIFFLLMIALIKVWKEETPIYKAYVITALIAYVLINYINIDKIIADNNLSRYQSTGKIDAHYLTTLSSDVVPLILPLLEDSNKEVALQVENGLSIKKNYIKDKSWQSFNISRYRASKLLEVYELKYNPEEMIYSK